MRDLLKVRDGFFQILNKIKSKQLCCCLGKIRIKYLGRHRVDLYLFTMVILLLLMTYFGCYGYDYFKFKIERMTYDTFLFLYFQCDWEINLSTFQKNKKTFNDFVFAHMFSCYHSSMKLGYLI